MIAHELSHSLASHSVESAFHISNLLFTFTMFALSDFFITPIIQEYYTNKNRYSLQRNIMTSRTHESEADFLALYLLKRAGYDIMTWPNVLNNISDETEFNTSLMKLVKTAQSDHPLIEDRVERVKKEIPIVEEDFKTKYEVEKKSLLETVTQPVNVLVDTVLQWNRLSFW